MPTRLLREGILSSDRIAQLQPEAEVFYRRLMSKVDDHGLFDARPAILQTQLFPLQLQHATENKCKQWLLECAGTKPIPLLVVYEVDGKPYLKMLDTKWQIRSEPKYPRPPDNILEQLFTTANSCALRRSRLSLSLFVDGAAGNATAASRQPKVNGHKIEFDPSKGEFIGITEAQELQWQDAYPAVPIPPAIAQAASWAQANPSNRKSNWQRFLVNWFKREQDKAARVRK